MITLQTLSANTVSTDLSGRYIMFLEPRIPRALGLSISRTILVRKMSVSPSGKVVTIEGPDDYRNLGMWFDTEKKFYVREVSEDNPEKTVVMTARVAENGKKILICDTIEEVVAMRNRDYERDIAQKLALQKVEQEMGFSFIEPGSEVSRG